MTVVLRTTPYIQNSFASSDTCHLPSATIFVRCVFTLARHSFLSRLNQVSRRRMAAPGFLDSISPWASRSTTPKNGEKASSDKAPPAGLNQQHGSDHRVNHRHRPSIRDYPDDCPPLNVKWFYAVDVRETSDPQPWIQKCLRAGVGPQAQAPSTCQTERQTQADWSAEEVRSLLSERLPFYRACLSQACRGGREQRKKRKRFRGHYGCELRQRPDGPRIWHNWQHEPGRCSGSYSKVAYQGSGE